jgi:hypothetical protein
MDPRDLYGLPLERFTAERNGLAKSLRQEGQRDEAARVSKLRKPSVAAWAVNQLVRTQGRMIDALFDAGDALQKAQADLLAGHADSGVLRKAVEAERTAVDELTARARGLLSSEGQELAAPKLEQVSETLHAAALDGSARAQVRDGCLERELRHIGLGAMSAAAPRPRSARRASKSVAADGPAQDGAAEQSAAQVKAARKAEIEARRKMERAARDRQAAEERRDRAAEALREAEERLASAQEVANEAAREHRRLEAEVEGL